MFLGISFILGGKMEEKYKYMAVWLYAISILSGAYLNVDDEGLRELIMGFIINYYEMKKDIFDKMFEFKMIRMGEVRVVIDYDKVAEYGNTFLTDPQKLMAIYDEIGKKDINEISRLAELFCDYCLEIDSMNNNRKRH